ncbi:Ig-like domain-containing protein [Thermophilibacter mediterraneus]|uniref:Ig-like domain-containing protein n=1 Tax=Thermophilibacter mediterraneus TaxID=1871031 RepID=UPI00235531C2|nr:Ig-like domain-containing protein [Thermophilibacter mediterraneus]
MARRTWWKVGALLAAMMMFLTMLPATALAAVPEGQIIYVGNESVTNGGYWTTDSNGNVTAYTGGDTPTDNYIHYDVANNTLTLYNATIKESVSTETSTYVASAAIGVLNQDGDAELTIKLEGVNTIEDVGKGIYVLASSYPTGAAILTITSESGGSLDASASQTGIWVQSNSGNATLTIENAKVEATGTNTAGYGVNVQSSNSSTAALTVDGGSLTASGSPGILYDSIGSGTVPKTTALTISNSAIVDARGGGIGAGLLQDLKKVSPADDSVGIVFGLDLSNSNAGTVYGNVTLQGNLEISEGESLMLDDGASLDANGHKVIVDGGTLGESLAESLDDSVIYKVTGVSLSPATLALKVSESASLTATIAPGNATNKAVEWKSDSTNVATVDNEGRVTAVGIGTATITVTAQSDNTKSAICTVTVTAATVPVTSVTLSQNQARLYYNGTPNTLALTATVAPDNATNKVVAWTSSNSAVATVDGSGNVTAVAPGTATITVTTADGGMTATCLVTVTGVYIPPRPTGPDWGDVADDISDAEPGSTVKVDMDGKTVLPGEVLDELAGSDVTLALDMGDGLFLEIYGGDVPADEEYDDVDLGVVLGGDDIPADVVNLVTGESGSVQVSLEHDGPFGFELTLVAPLGEDAAGLVANLYRYDDEAGSLGYEATAQVDNEGVARLPFDHASSWLVALDSRSHALPFPDALEGAWYSEAVRWAWLGGVMTGYGDGSGLFGTSSALTRAEAAVVLWRLAGEPEGAFGLPADCDPSGFYAEAASWALGAGVFSGYSGDAFGPADTITREQLATVLWRAAGSPEVGGDLSSFSDAADVSDFADVAMRWAVSAGVLRGQGDGDALDPQGACTRAQLATMLYRLAAAE